MTDVFDLDAAEAEAARSRFPFRYGGREWSLAHLADLDWRVVARADTGDMEAVREAVRDGLGADQHAEFEQLRQPVSAMTALFDRWLTHSGLRPGESPASTDSSGSTAGPSKRPSRRTTQGSGSGTSTPGS